MNTKIKDLTSYFRSTVAASVNRKIELKTLDYYDVEPAKLSEGKLDEYIFENLTRKEQEDRKKERSKKRDSINVIIVLKTIKTIFDNQAKKDSSVEDLTGIYYMPAILKRDGTLLYEQEKVPWIPREFLQPLVEADLSIGHIQDYDKFLSDNMGRINKIETWADYFKLTTDLYEYVTKTIFFSELLLDIELEKRAYIFEDTTVNATRAILKLYDDLSNKDCKVPLYETFMQTDFAATASLIGNDLERMQKHCGQMNGEYPLSPSQRECINHFSCMENGEILAVNGPPGTGKTTLLQSIVANLVVEKALRKAKPPLIVAASTNNQAVTNIIESFGKIKVIGYGNLEERWIEGVKSFAVYFPSKKQKKAAEKNGYHYTSATGSNFIEEIETAENLAKSKEKMVTQCSLYFNQPFSTIDECQGKIYDALCEVDHIRKDLLEIAHEFSSFKRPEETFQEALANLAQEKKCLTSEIEQIKHRLVEWKKHFDSIPMLYKLFSFLTSFKDKIAVKNRLFISIEEDFIEESMSYAQIEEKYSLKYKTYKNKLGEVTDFSRKIEQLQERFEKNKDVLQALHIDVFAQEKKTCVKNAEHLNETTDKNLKYVAFWLAIHYYECRWLKGEDSLSEKQKTKTYKNVLQKLYNRLSMVTPCYVMTFYQLPKNFRSQEKEYLYNHIDLLIVDEAGQVSPEIAAGSFSLAKNAVVVGDIHQIEPVWSVSNTVDKSLALSCGAITSISQFEKLKELGLNSSDSSVMQVAAKSCRYKKFHTRGLFLSEHRRCYDEIIAYCNDLVYQGNLEPLRGCSAADKKYQLQAIPQMGHRQITTEYSSKKGGSRFNQVEAAEIARWIHENFQIIQAAYPNVAQQNLIGVITPFKAQVNCIKNEIKKLLPEDIAKAVGVGTVHAFQGAEKQLIILSTAYGREEGCYFIDANKSMLNVAVSRAKDSFLVFGNLDSLQNDKSSASGLLKQYVRNNAI
ncbi:AAA domain-containing protein [Anaerospora hongkongensis]|uniref:AAA domain-containing protein n=1 Tax=Anaerospora hongkongensis TaxID=244830 RepID=A0A4R1PWF2_9FIRM|nr:AAA domain-containing protein [Anaerospora hongkongensis]TCL36787.1 AAA domain-containing protein [Anaerospora hongkongensis]